MEDLKLLFIFVREVSLQKSLGSGSWRRISVEIPETLGLKPENYLKVVVFLINICSIIN